MLRQFRNNPLMAAQFKAIADQFEQEIANGMVSVRLRFSRADFSQKGMILAQTDPAERPRHLSR